MAYPHHHQQPAYAPPQPPQPPPPQVVPEQAAYAAGYQAGYQAGYDAGYWAAIAQGQQGQLRQEYASQPGVAAINPQLPYRPSAKGPPLPPTAAAAPSAAPASSLPPTIPPRPAQAQTPLPLANPTPPQPHPQIWQPAPNTTFNYVLASPPPTAHPVFPLHRFDVWIVDLFDTPAETVRLIHEAGKRAVAYFSAGSWEDWRDDKGEFFGDGEEGKGGKGKRGKGEGKGAAVLGKPLDGWKGERWVDVRDERVRDVMRRRLDLAREKGFDGVDPDNVDGYENKNGLGLTRADAVAFVAWLAGEARSRGLACGLKNGGGFVKEVVGLVGWVVVEEAVRYKETERFECVVRAGKPVWGVEYPKGEDEEDERCNDERRVEGRKRDEALRMRRRGWSCVIKNVRLDLWVQVD